jgi:hypothetical protein
MASGTVPTAACAGTYNNLIFTYQDSGSPNALTATSAALTLTITAAPAIAFSPALPAGAVGAAYAGSVTATGGLGALTYSLASGALPADLALNTATGAIKGTPKAADTGTAKFTIAATDAYGDSAISASLSLAIAAAPAITFPSSLTGGTVGTAYAGSVAATGGAGALTYSVASGALPADLALNKATGAITGTPKAADRGTAKFTIAATDAYGDSATSASLSLAIAAAPAITFPSSLTGGTVGTAYTGSAAATGGAGALTYSVASGALPADLTLNTATGAITGTPKAADVGTAAFTISASDAYGDTATSGSLSITVTGPTITFPLSLAGGMVGTAYNASAAASGALGTTTYSIASGALPASGNLVLNTSTGAIIGTPHAADVGTATFKVKVVDAYGDTATSGNLSITVTGPTITFPLSLVGGMVGTAYSASAAASGALGTTTYSIASGALPASGNLVLNPSTGAITGTPHAADLGTATFKVQVVDAYGDTATSGNLNIAITAAPSIAFTSNTIRAGTYNVAYNGSAAATGGAGALTYSISAGALPASGDLALNTSTGTITGTPSKTADVGTFNFTVKAADAFGDSNTQAYTLVVSYPALSITTASPLPVGYGGVPYSQQFQATGGSGTGYSWAVTTVVVSPSTVGLSLSSGGLLSGASPIAGTANFTVQVTDSASDIGSSSFSVTINPALTITTGATLPQGFAGVAYSQSLGASGGSGSNYSWSVTSGSSSLTAVGLTLSNGGLLSGSTPVAGNASFTAKVIDGVGNTSSQTFSVKINAGIAITTPNPLPSDIVNQPYAGVTFTAGGGSGSGYTWTQTAATLPAGMSFNAATAALTGTPSATGSFSLSLKVKDSVGNTASETFTFSVYPVLSFTPTSLPTAYVGTPYSQSLSGQGGSGSGYTYTITLGGNTLTNVGLTLNSAGLIAGTPTATGSPSFTVKVTDGSGDTASANVSFTVSAGVSITTSSPLPSGYAGTAYSQALTATGGSGSGYTWTVTSGATSLTAVGLTLSNGGLVAGSSPVAGNASFTAEVTDGLGNTASHSFTVTIEARLTITTLSLPAGPVNVPYQQQLAATGGSGILTSWQITTGASSLTAIGLNLNTMTGAIAGNTPTLGTANFSVTVTDSQGHTSAPVAYTININNQLKVTQTTLPPGNQGDPYSQKLTASGGTGAGYTWTATSSNLGSYGLSLASNGDGTATISGTPTQTGTAGFTANVKDSGAATAQQPLSIQVNSGLSLTPPNTLPQAYTGVGYTGGVDGSGGSGNLTISVTSALSPADGTLAINVVGAHLSITGIPTAATTVSFGVKLTDNASGNTASQNYSVAVNTPTPPVLPGTDPGSLGSGTVNQGYSGLISATGGTGSYYWMVNGTQVPTSGNLPLGSSGLSSQFNVVNNSNSNTLTVNGNPTSTGTVNFSAEIFDNTTGLHSSSVNYSVQVNAAGSPVSGQVYFNGNSCNGGNNLTLPTFTISINTNPVQTTTTDSSGNYSFASIPNGTYTLTPSMVGSNLPEYMFTPGSLKNVVVNNNSYPGANFNVMLGYTVSGTVAYGGGAPGIIYLSLNSNCGGNAENGTAISARGPFTIRGVAPGNYSISAWRDNLGFGQPNASNPAGSLNSVSVTDANLTGQGVTLHDPGAVTLSAAPQISIGGAWANGALINFNPPTNNNGVETPQSYTLEWSTSTTFPTPGSGNSDSIPATGANGSNLWILNTANVTGLTSGNTYYFRAQGVAGSSTSSWSSTVGPIKLVAPTTSGNTVSGNVTFSGTATGPLYVGFYDQSSNKVYATQVGSKTNPPTSPANYSVVVPTGTNYFFFAIIDQNNDGLDDSGDITNTNGSNQSSVSISGDTTENLTLPSAASIATVTTQLQQSPDGQGGNNSSYSLNVEVSDGIKLPASVTLASGPNVLNPVDMGSCGNNCGSPQFEYYVNLGGLVPAVNDTYAFDVTYVDGTSETVNGSVTGVLTSSALATLTAPTGTGIADQPNFDWSYPANPGNYTYSFWLCCGNNGNIWQIPGNNSKSNGFTNSQITPPLDWGVDPTDSGNAPSPSTLGLGNSYSWSIQSQDANGNSAQVYDNFTIAGAGALSLPTTDPSTLPAAVVNAPYNGTITATGGAPPYQYLVTGSSCFGCEPINLPDGLVVTDAHDNTLVVGGTPTSTTSPGSPVTFQVTVKDSLGSVYGTVSYTIAVNNATPVSLPAANTNPLGGGLTGAPYGGTVNASGGSGSYSFVVNGTTIPTNNAYVTVANGDGLTAKNSGGNTLFFAGTPATSETVSLAVKVIDTNNISDTATVTYSVVMSSGPTGVNNGNLKGTYTCKINGYSDSDGSRWASLTSMVADGSGHLSSGVFDTNGSDFTSEMSGTLNGSYSIGADNNGLASTSFTVTSGGTGSGTNSWAIALTDAVSPALQFQMVETDDVGASPSGQHGTANCYLATTSAFNVSTINGNGFVFGVQGENGNGAPKAYVGRISASGGNVTSGILDGMRLDQSGDGGGTFTSGTYTSPDANGRFTLSLTAGGGTIDLLVYIIDANRMFELESAGDTGLMAGDMRTQHQSSYSTANLNGAFVLYSEAWDGWNGSSVTAYDDSIFQGTGSASGMTINESYMDNNGTFDNGGANGGPIAPTFDSSNPGRATFPAGNDSGYLYMFNNNSAIYLDLNGSSNHLEFGWIEPQSQSTFNNSALTGIYMLSDFAETQAHNSSDVGEIAIASGGSITANISTGGEGEFEWDQAQSGLTYNWLSSTYGSFSMTGGGGGGTTCVVISPSKIVCLDNTSSSAKLTILQM